MDIKSNIYYVNNNEWQLNYPLEIKVLQDEFYIDHQTLNGESFISCREKGSFRNNAFMFKFNDDKYVKLISGAIEYHLSNDIKLLVNKINKIVLQKYEKSLIELSKNYDLTFESLNQLKESDHLDKVSDTLYTSLTKLDHLNKFIRESYYKGIDSGNI
jgi:hypothetical protein